MVNRDQEGIKGKDEVGIIIKIITKKRMTLTMIDQKRMLVRERKKNRR
jgi:hypothetical protein